VNITLLPSSVSAQHGANSQFLTTYLINDTVAIDAGSLGLIEDLSVQSRVTDVFLTHSHIDHVATLPVFLDNVYKARGECVTIHGDTATLECLRHDFFNGRIWPDFIELTTIETPFLRLATLEPGRAVEVKGLRLTPVPVNHAVPTLGFLVEEPGAAVAFSSDTGPTDELWRLASAAADLKAVFLEASFPNRLSELAALARHLTPSLFAHELSKLHRPAKAIAVHIKPRFSHEIMRELAALNLPNLEIGQPGRLYQF
jgi:ribonuclease BN (tRNA processing enzyme)